MAKDPWEHRSRDMVCGTCMHFGAKGPGALGRCRRHAPTMQGYPAVYVDEPGCGDHKLAFDPRPQVAPEGQRIDASKDPSGLP